MEQNIAHTLLLGQNSGRINKKVFLDIYFPGEPAGERSPADEKTACRVVPGQNEKMENDALRAHCRWLQERLDQLEAERRDLNRENRQLWQKNADLGERLARLEQSQELARGHARAAGDDSMAALAVSRHGGRCTRLQESCKTEGN